MSLVAARPPRNIRGGQGHTSTEFLQQYLQTLHQLGRETAAWIPELVRVKTLLLRTSRQGRKVIVIGNGGSAAMASHVAVDLTKNAKVRAINFNEADLLTCFANDYGFEQALAQAVEQYGDPGDVLIAISSSGRSANILNACQAARHKQFAAIVTLSGLSPDNPLRRLGDYNFWVDSRAYNLVETIHQFWLLALVDAILGRAEYPAKPGAS